jgi:tRNA (mo5U34)-methyltransferase
MAQQLSPAQQRQVTLDYLQEAARFKERAAQLGLGDLSRYYWYHTVDVGEGLVTPGIYDFRPNWLSFEFPDDMHGMDVLDIGSATGFFAFEFEKRGARVTSVELPSLSALDRFPGQSVEQSIEKIERMLDPGFLKPQGEQGAKLTAEECYFFLLEGPFEFCRQRLGSQVERRYATVYELSEAKLGKARFDLVFLGDVLLHTLHPLEALAAVAPLCSGRLILSQYVPPTEDDRPAMIYVGGDDPSLDEVSWWWPNLLCLTQILRKLGFGDVREIGRHSGVLKSTGYVYERSILHAVK